MNNVFIGWGGNQPLAEELAKIIDKDGTFNAVLGGGVPSDMFIGAQVIDQINNCKKAILLVEDTKNGFSHNLMFEWGYIMAKYNFNDIHVFLINKSSKDLPSDLLGSWVSEIKVDRENESDEQIAKKIFDVFYPNSTILRKVVYFDLIENWKQVFVYLSDNIPDSDQETFDYIFTGCMAAYYYQDYQNLRVVLNQIKVNKVTMSFTNFAKSYINVFIDSENLTAPLPQESFFKCIQIFESTKERQKYYDEERETLIDILLNDIIALSCSLYLKNEGLDEETIKFCSEMASTGAKKVLELLDDYEASSTHNSMLVLLMRSYIYKDVAHIYLYQFNDKEQFLNFLNESVDVRKKLWQSFLAFYPNNVFLATKFEQEYILALSELCNYLPSGFQKTLYKKIICTKMQEWEKELVYASSLTDKIKQNVAKFTD